MKSKLKLNGSHEVGDSLIEVFDFKKHWKSLVVPHLHHPEVEQALARGMNAYRVMRRDLSIARTGNPGAWVEPWNPEHGPLDNDSSDYWLLRGRYPKPDSLESYQLHHAGHYLAPFQRELGKLLFPELKWKVKAGGEHALACGEGADGSIRMLLDILHFEDVLRPSRREPMTVIDHVNFDTLDNTIRNLESRESQVFERTALGLLELASRKRVAAPQSWTELLTARQAAGSLD